MVYTFKRPSAENCRVATATDASGKNATKQLIVSPSTVNGVIKPSDSSLTITSQFDITWYHTDKESPYVVKNAGKWSLIKPTTMASSLLLGHHGRVLRGG